MVARAQTHSLPTVAFFAAVQMVGSENNVKTKVDYINQAEKSLEQFSCLLSVYNFPYQYNFQPIRSTEVVKKDRRVILVLFVEIIHTTRYVHPVRSMNANSTLLPIIRLHSHTPVF